MGSVSSGRLILERVEVQIGVGLPHRLLDVFAYQTLSSSVITSFMTDRVCGMLIFFEVFYLIYFIFDCFDYIYCTSCFYYTFFGFSNLIIFIFPFYIC